MSTVEKPLVLHRLADQFRESGSLFGDPHTTAFGPRPAWHPLVTPGRAENLPDGSVPRGVGEELRITTITKTTTYVCSELSSFLFFYICDLI